jgi:hypothetical protein
MLRPPRVRLRVLLQAQLRVRLRPSSLRVLPRVRRPSSCLSS